MSEIPKMLIGQCQHTLPAILRLVEAEIFPAVNAKWAEEETAQLRKELLVSITYLFIKTVCLFMKLCVSVKQKQT